MRLTRERKVIEEALRLPPAARAALAGTLIDSLDAEVDADAEEAWSDEIARRVQELEAGDVKSVPWGEVRRSVLRSRRATSSSTQRHVFR